MCLKLKFFTLIVKLSLCSAFYASYSDIKELTMHNFQQVYSLKDIWIVDFYAPWSEQSQQFVNTFVKLSTVVKGMATTAAFNADTRHYFPKQIGISTLPQIKFYGITHNATDYNGKRTVEALMGAVLVAMQRKINYRQEIPQKSYKQVIVKLNDENFEENLLMSDKTWLVEFYSPSCGITRTFSPKFEKLCRKLKTEGIICAMVETEKNLKTVEELRVNTHPMFYYFPRGLKSKYSYDVFEGPLDPVEIMDWVLSWFNETIPVPTLYQLTDELTARKACSQTELCVIVIVPTIFRCNSTCRYQHLNKVFNVIRKFKTYPWGWLWFESDSQPFIQSLMFKNGLTEPRVAVVDIKNKVYMSTKKPFEEAELEAFFKRITMNSSVKREIKVAKLPRVNTIPLWDGENVIVTEARDEL